MKTASLPRTRRGQPRVAETNGNGQITAAPEKPKKGVQLVKLERARAEIHIKSETGLIVHEFSEKSIQQMLDKQTGKASRGREKKDPLAAFQGSLYRMAKNKGYGFPARGFKACFVRAANDVELMKTEMKRAIRILGTGDESINVDGLIEIIADPLPKDQYSQYDIEYAKELKDEHAHGISMRRDVVRLENGVADIRFRGYFPKWRAVVPVMWNSRVISLEQLLALVDAAGFGVGIGEWRPGAPKSESGQFGCFVVDLSKTVTTQRQG